MYSSELVKLGQNDADFLNNVQQHLFPIEVDIVQSLYEMYREARTANDPQWFSDGYWTKRVKSALYELGRKDGYLVYPTPEKGTGKFVSQWMFDLVWVNAKADAGAFDWKGSRGLKLACESEWHATEDDILWDFVKLTFVLAELRLFVYTNRRVQSGDQKRHPVDLCRRVCPLSRGFRYLLVGIPSATSAGFRVDAWTA